MNEDPLSVLFHPYVFWNLKVSGVGRYMVELGEALEKQGVELHCPIKDTPTELLLQAPFYERCAAETPRAPLYLRAICALGMKTKKAEQFCNLLRRWEGVQAMERGRFDIIHPTHNNAIEILKHRKKSALVVTVHDMIHEIYPEQFGYQNISTQRKKIMAQEAQRVIAISHKTKQDLVNMFGIDADKVDVVHHGNSLVLPPDAATRPMNLPKRYLLFVGLRHGYKNFVGFLEAAARLMAKDDSLELVCAGGGGFTPEELTLIHKLHIANRIQQMWVSDDALAILYNRALAFVYPSAYEGFGLPILEGYSCKTPVLCANASCFPEVAGEGSIYFDANEPDDIYDALERITSSEQLRQEMITRGSQRLSQFSWAKCAHETKQSYLKALS